MRVIAGKFRSRVLHGLRGMDIRPTSDRLRETLFNVLTAGNPEALAGSLWLDLFAGTGAVGIEALSRGAQMVYFVENSRTAAHTIKENLKSLAITSGFEVLEQSSIHALVEFERRGLQPDFIFLDPPYRLQDAYLETFRLLNTSRLAARALVIAEHDKHFDPNAEFGSLLRNRRLSQGDAVLSFYRRT